MDFSLVQCQQRHSFISAPAGAAYPIPTEAFQRSRQLLVFPLFQNFPGQCQIIGGQMTTIRTTLLSAACLLMGASLNHASALSPPIGIAAHDTGLILVACNPGSPNCIKKPPNYPVHGKNTLQNIGDCQGSSNETCGYKTPYAVHKPVNPQPGSTAKVGGSTTNASGGGGGGGSHK